jgi:hypothetical protein
MAKIRLNRARRLLVATGEAIRCAAQAGSVFPYDFSYEEEVPTRAGRVVRQRVHARLWSSADRFDEVPGPLASDPSLGTGTSVGQRAGAQFFVEHLRTDAVDSRLEPEPFWFLELFEHDVFTQTPDPDRLRKRGTFYERWGYETHARWLGGDVLGFSVEHGKRLARLRSRDNRVLFSAEGVYAACLFAHLVVRLMTVTGARLGEVQQVAQNPDCVKQLVNVGPKGATRWVLRLVPKGHTQRADYFIDEETKNALTEVVRYLREKHKVKQLPIVSQLEPKLSPDRYVLQWNGRSLTQGDLNALVRLLLHGLVVSETGNPAHLSTHILRHAFATELAELGVRIDVIAKLLNQRNTSTTRYYARPTEHQVMSAAELLFVDRIDVATEAKRSPAEIEHMLHQSEGKIGALTEVIGGTCTVANLCPAKFACIGCSGLAPDPAKRSQVERKMKWAAQQRTWAEGEDLCAEARQMRQIEQDCQLVLEEMELIEAARKDAEQLIVVQYGSSREEPV